MRDGLSNMTRAYTEEELAALKAMPKRVTNPQARWLDKPRDMMRDDASRKNTPTAEHQAVMAQGERNPVRAALRPHNRDVPPRLVRRGKDEQEAAVQPPFIVANANEAGCSHDGEFA